MSVNVAVTAEEAREVTSFDRTIRRSICGEVAMSPEFSALCDVMSLTVLASNVASEIELTCFSQIFHSTAEFRQLCREWVRVFKNCCGGARWAFKRATRLQTAMDNLSNGMSLPPEGPLLIPGEQFRSRIEDRDEACFLILQQKALLEDPDFVKGPYAEPLRRYRREFALHSTFIAHGRKRGFYDPIPGRGGRGRGAGGSPSSARDRDGPDANGGVVGGQIVLLNKRRTSPAVQVYLAGGSATNGSESATNASDAPPGTAEPVGKEDVGTLTKSMDILAVQNRQQETQEAVQPPQAGPAPAPAPAPVPAAATTKKSGSGSKVRSQTGPAKKKKNKKVDKK